jgi:hypothetical protein
MDIPSLSMNYASTNVSTAASLKVLKMSMDTAEETGQALANMISKTSVNVQV